MPSSKLLHEQSIAQISQASPASTTNQNHNCATKVKDSKHKADVDASGDGKDKKGSNRTKEAKKHGAGGAWRAFVHHEQRGQKFTPARVQELSQKYANLTEAERDFYLRMGTTATHNREVGTATFPTHSRRSRSARSLPTIAGSASSTSTLRTVNPSHAETLAQIESGAAVALLRSALPELPPFQLDEESSTMPMTLSGELFESSAASSGLTSRVREPLTN